MSRALIPIADGTEEIELAATANVLVRGGFHVTVASVGSSKTCKLSRGLKVVADALLDDLQEKTVFDVIVCPGGMPGAENLSKNHKLSGILKHQAEEGRWVAGICAAPAVVLAPLGILQEKTATCYPSRPF